MKFLHEYLEYGNGKKIDNGWWEIRGDKLFNRLGGFHYYKPSDDDIIVEAKSFIELDWTCMLKPESPFGKMSNMIGFTKRLRSTHL